MNFIRRLAAVLCSFAIIAALAYFANSGKDSERGAVTVWYANKGVLSEQLEALVKSYNASLTRKTLPVETSCFENEQKLSEAFQTGSPDIVVCSHYSAFALYDRSKLTDISSALKDPPMYPRTVTSRSNSIGKSFFPIGFSLPVLVSNDKLIAKVPTDSLSAFLKTASDYTSKNSKPFFACESFAEFFYAELLRQGRDFEAELDTLDNDKVCLGLYNSLASAAFDGSLALVSEGCAQYVANAALPCAIVHSNELHGIKLEGLSVADIPTADNAINNDTVGVAYGIAVTNGGCRSVADTAAFVEWLFSDSRSIKMAEENCLAPAEGLVSGKGGSVYAGIAANKIVSLPTLSSAYSVNKDEFDERLTEAMRLLLP